MRKIINLLLILIMFATVYGYYRFENFNDDEYKKHIILADKYLKMGAIEDALLEYKKCQALKADPVVDKKVFDIYISSKDLDSAKKYIESKHGQNKLDTNTLDKYLDVCFNKKNWKEYNYILETMKSDYKLNKHLVRIFDSYDVTNSPIDSVIQVNNNTFLVKKDDKNIIIDSEGKLIFSDNEYKPLGIDEDNKIVTAAKGEEIKFINIDRTIRASTNEKDIIPMFDGYYLLKKSNYELKNKFGETKLSKEFISSLNDGKFAALQKGRVSVYDKGLKTIVDFKATKVKVNLNNQAVVDNKIIVFDGKFRMIDLEKKNESKSYDDIDFSYGEKIAIKKNGKWAYMDQTFKEVSEFKFDDAKSFSWGIAFIKEDNGYKMINGKYQSVNKEVYDDIISFNKEGIGFIKSDNSWSQIKLRRAIK